jgi:hypothetical protein
MSWCTLLGVFMILMGVSPQDLVWNCGIALYAFLEPCCVLGTLLVLLVFFYNRCSLECSSDGRFRVDVLCACGNWVVV